MLPGAGIGVSAGEFSGLKLVDGRPKSDKPWDSFEPAAAAASPNCCPFIRLAPGSRNEWDWGC